MKAKFLDPMLHKPERMHGTKGKPFRRPSFSFGERRTLRLAHGGAKDAVHHAAQPQKSHAFGELNGSITNSRRRYLVEKKQLIDT